MLHVRAANELTCSCLMVSPPLPMTRPTLLAGMRSCWMELLPSMSLWKPGPYRHCSTISLSNLFAWLERRKPEPRHLSSHLLSSHISLHQKENLCYNKLRHWSWDKENFKFVSYITIGLFFLIFQVLQLTLCFLDSQSVCMVCPTCHRCLWQKN